MDPFILNDLLRRVASGRTTQADADFLQEAFGRLAGWLDPRQSRPADDSMVMVLWTLNSDVYPCYFRNVNDVRVGPSAQVGEGFETTWGDSCIKPWCPWPEPPAHATRQSVSLTEKKNR